MATIRKRGRYWQAQIIRKGFPAQYKTFDTKGEAENWAKVVESEMVRRVFVSRDEADKTTLAQALARYQREILPTKKSQKTVLSQIKVINVYLGERSLSALSSSMIAKFRDDRLRRDQVDPQTVRKDLALLRRLLDLAIKEWGIALPHGNIVKQVSLPKQPAGRDRRLAGGEERRLTEALADNPSVNGVVRFALETAMRRGEIAAMRWEHIDWSKKTLLIPATKTEKPRTIPLSVAALTALGELQSRREGLVWGLRPDSITQAFDRACQRAGITDLRFHDLRHEATSRLVEEGLGLMEVASITGHQDLKMLKRYTHPRAEDLVVKLG